MGNYRIKQTGAFSLIETIYREDGNIESFEVLCAGKIESWQGLKDLLYYYYQITYKDNSQYEVIWDEDPGAYRFVVRDKRLGYIFAEMEILITDLAYNF